MVIDTLLGTVDTTKNIAGAAVGLGSKAIFGAVDTTKSAAQAAVDTSSKALTNTKGNQILPRQLLKQLHVKLL